MTIKVIKTKHYIYEEYERLKEAYPSNFRLPCFIGKYHYYFVKNNKICSIHPILIFLKHSTKEDMSYAILATALTLSKKNNCGSEVYFDDTKKTEGGKWLPVDRNTNQNHDCPNDPLKWL